MNFTKLFSIHRITSVQCRGIKRGGSLFSPDGPGSGAGKGGGSGSERESSGGLGKFVAAQEEGYFLGKQREQLEKIKQKLKLKREKGIEQKKED